MTQPLWERRDDTTWTHEGVMMRIGLLNIDPA